MAKARSSESETGARSSALGGGALYDRLLMRLWCAECGRPSGPEAKGWRLYRTDDEDDPEDEVTVLTAYCRACVVREFGDTRTERRTQE